MNPVEQAQQDARVLWARLPKNLKEKVEEPFDRLEEFFSKIQDTLEGDGDFGWLEADVDEE